MSEDRCRSCNREEDLRAGICFSCATIAELQAKLKVAEEALLHYADEFSEPEDDPTFVAREALKQIRGK